MTETPPGGATPLAVVVVLPTYNERDNIDGLARAVLELPLAPDVLVVDDSSPDGTAEVVRRLADEFPGRVELLQRPRREGLGRAYVSAFTRVLEQGRHDALVQMDVDGSHRPDDLPRLLGELAHADVVLGSRYVPGGRVVGWPLHRLLLSRAGNLYARTVLGLAVRDLTGGFKAWRLPLLSRLDLATVRSGGYAFQIETTVRALRAGAVVWEVPVVFRDRELGESKMSPRIAREAIGTVLRLRGVRPGGRRGASRQEQRPSAIGRAEAPSDRPGTG
ncbi:MAG: polyprenol monophosphomannose synthase [Actinomycetota bacterium]|nr:polyprenol monophosphomannose synthase [Actinomycetota bacterium]